MNCADAAQKNKRHATTHFQRSVGLAILNVVMLVACAQTDFDRSGATRGLDTLMQNTVLSKDQGGDGLQNPAINIIIPDKQFNYSFASGTAQAWSKELMTVNHQFHTASVGKTFTAALILQLSEDGLLGPDGLDTTLLKLSIFDDLTLERLHIVDGVSYGPEITVRQLLLHSSGLKDQFGDDANGSREDYGREPAPGGLMFLMQRDMPAHMECLQDPSCDSSDLITKKLWKHWDPEHPKDPFAGMLNFYVNQMGHAGYCAPGSCYHYSDIGYVILGLIAEKVAGKTLHGLFRERIFDPLNMDRSYLAYGVNPDSSRWEENISDFYMGGIPAVSAGLNLSFDWGGGGVVTTAVEQNRFFVALLEGKLFTKPETLAEMIDWQVIPGMNDYLAGVGLGLSRFKGPDGLDTWAKYGAWGNGMLFDPQTGAYISGTNNSSSKPSGWWTRIIIVLREASKKD